MTRHDVLRSCLMCHHLGEEAKQKHVEWATVHNPLMSPSMFTITGRYINRFLIGSDPEFCFVDREGMRIPSKQAGLYVGLAAGADQNERLVELRPWPAISAVDHVAGILTELRWLMRVHGPSIFRYRWRAGAFFAGDGIGGHIHFGRKRPSRPEEVLALDGLAKAMLCAGLFPQEEWLRRQQGDDYRNPAYGLPGDFRVQKHGYEYRSLPSWLQSPEIAFIVLSLSKLAIIDPEITSTWNAQALTIKSSRDLLRGLAKLYKGRDDDAYLLYSVLTRNGDIPFQIPAFDLDITSAWGIPPYREPEFTTRMILPASIKPNPEEIEEVRLHLLSGTPLTWKKYPANFITGIPEKYLWAPEYIDPGRRSGFGDLLHNLVYHVEHKVTFDYSNDNQFVIRGGILKLWCPSEREIVRNFYPEVQFMDKELSATVHITVPKCLCQALTISGFRDLLVNSGLFPLWTVDTVKPESAPMWSKNRRKATKAQSWRTC